MSEVRRDDLAQRPGIVAEGDGLVQDAGRAVFARHAAQFNAAPGREGEPIDFLQHVVGAPAQGYESDAPLVEAMEIGMGGESGIKNQFLGPFSRALFPELGEA